MKCLFVLVGLVRPILSVLVLDFCLLGMRQHNSRPTCTLFPKCPLCHHFLGYPDAVFEAKLLKGLVPPTKDFKHEVLPKSTKASKLACLSIHCEPLGSQEWRFFVTVVVVLVPDRPADSRRRRRRRRCAGDVLHPGPAMPPGPEPVLRLCI